ncbi:MAG TPA: class I SAM-dependent methyltransferase [Anaerolineae bacterium]|nr:class I SAM-dependent methyltransferase [Anaerolineae bacterium]
MNSELQKPSLPSTLYTEDYFLNACEGYEEFVESQGERLSRRLTEAFAYAEVKPGMQVLDVGCGRGEILRHVTKLGARAYGIDYAEVAVKLSREATKDEATPIGVYRTDAKRLPYPDNMFDRALMFDVVEHLFPWELNASLSDIYRILKPGGMIVVHTAPNRWYDRYAYPFVRFIRRLQGKKYPANPRALNVEANVEVHVNEQDIRSMKRYLRRAGFHHVKVWLNSPPQNRHENILFRAARHIAFEWLPFRWFFEREVFAVGVKNDK